MLILKIALRNILGHRLKTLVTGAIIVFGTFLIIVGNAFVDAVSSGMKNSLINSIVGDFQIYSESAKEKLSIYGTLDGAMPDVGHVNNFKNIRDQLLNRIDNIKAIIPMGTNFSIINPGNILDIKLEQLRSFYKKQTDESKLGPLKSHVRTIVEDINQAYKQNVEGVFSVDTAYADFNIWGEAAPKNLSKALSLDFWHNFDSHHEERIEFLANKIAPLIFDDTMLPLSYLGTVPALFRDSFSLFEVVKGKMIPEGKRGYLFNDFLFETVNKHRVAKRLDDIKKQIEKNHYRISSDKSLAEKIKVNVAQAAEIYHQLDPVQTAQLLPKLRKGTGSNKATIKELLEDF
ncbi:MAG: hypothetical protein HY537_18900, partial [Deltaproteobacteria bacterium]|nr:hypothetical protein [Deltaproteobacteria bacterium]